MTTIDDTVPEPAMVPPATSPYRRITRSGDDRIIAGVSGGLGRYANVDPVIVRILFVALALFGGSGIVLYAVGWLALPDHDQTVSPLQRLSDRVFKRRPR